MKVAWVHMMTTCNAEIMLDQCFFVICEHRQCLDRFRTLPLNYTTDRWVDSKSGDVCPTQGFCRFASSSRGILRSDSGRMKKEYIMITRAERQPCHGSTFRIARSDIALTIGKTTECPDVPRCNHKPLCVMFDICVPKLTRMRWIQFIADMPTLVQILCLLWRSLGYRCPRGMCGGSWKFVFVRG